jgi:hypothetical protein
VLADPDLKGLVSWRTSMKLYRSGHRPDLTVRVNGRWVAVEVELQRKNASRMAAILTMYRWWIAEGKIAGVVYVCGTEARADRVRELMDDVGIAPEQRRIELLSDVREQAGQGRSQPLTGSAAASSA